MKEISIKTSFGTLVACVGGDDEYPEILVFLRKDTGGELMLCAITDLSISETEDAMRIAVYGDTQMEDYTQRVVLTRDEISSKDAMWQ